MIGHVWVPPKHIESRMSEFDDLEEELGEDGDKIAGIGTLV
jgi:hypothetical protein